jgi:hypothetical protein
MEDGGEGSEALCDWGAMEVRGRAQWGGGLVRCGDRDSGTENIMPTIVLKRWSTLLGRGW